MHPSPRARINAVTLYIALAFWVLYFEQEEKELMALVIACAATVVLIIFLVLEFFLDLREKKARGTRR